ncbi:MAG: hypothetical protein KAH20_10235 [Methylococcales bacterium]|nr:hypothetical protein [Methylococcales bacterium]
MKYKYLILFSSGVVTGALFKRLLIFGLVIFVISLAGYFYIKQLKVS